jgi:hypothetical protein
MVLRKVWATTVLAYDFEFPSNDNGSASFTQMRNQIIMKAGPLPLIFVRAKAMRFWCDGLHSNCGILEGYLSMNQIAFLREYRW